VLELNKIPLFKKKKIVEAKWPDLLSRKKVETKEKQLPPLPKVEEYPFVHVRFAPNPDGRLHIGSSRAAILCNEYAKMYGGRFTLRFDDSDPKTKSPIVEAYEWIRNDLRWLGVKWNDEVFQSDRLEIYYGFARQLIEMGVAYVCVCNSIKFKQRILAKEACPCRTLTVSEHLVRWEGMLNGFFMEKEAVVRIKTDLNHPNPAVREWPALRIINIKKFPHPRTGDKYRVWPLFAFCCGIDDHELQISHILRGKEHLTNSTRQHFLYKYLNWKYPEAIHYGRFKMVDTVFSKSKIREGIKKGVYKGWDDPRLGTLIALKKRGFLSETIRQLIMNVGPSPVDVTLNWDNIFAYNRKKVDILANRYFFVSNPVKLLIYGVKKDYISKHNIHPNDLNRGQRILKVIPKNECVSILISNNDISILKLNKVIRLMGLINIRIKKINKQVVSDFYSESYMDAKKRKTRLIHWIPDKSGIMTSVIMPDASHVSGIAEKNCKDLKPGDIVQFERFGFVRIEKMDNKITAYYAHN
ncbi:glutamate--tRNA ligase, partial [Candidatus Bathyarchaeota archaeon]|nr:glutamate--tRNA ligase [Candidatus Bathyarchaeota archaeon]